MKAVFVFQWIQIVHHLVEDLFLYSFEDDFVQHLQKSNISSRSNKLISLFDVYIDDILALNNHKFNDYIDVIYPNKYKINNIYILQNGLIILFLVWSLMRMVDFTLDYMTSMMTDFPIVNFQF